MFHILFFSVCKDNVFKTENEECTMHIMYQ